VKEKTFSSNSTGKRTKAFTSKLFTLHRFILPQKGAVVKSTCHLKVLKDVLIRREGLNDWKNYVFYNEEPTHGEDKVKIGQGLTPHSK